MTIRWTADQVVRLAPDAASRQAAARLAGSRRWSRTGAAGQAVWGLCTGSGSQPYQTVVDLSGPAYSCSCPSRKFPCKHALALLLGWADGAVPDAAEPADFAQSWLASRAGRADRAATTPARAGRADEAAAARRAEQRRDRVGAGLAELETWLRDQVRAGLSGTTGYRAAERVAARMVDAQAPGVAGLLRGTGGIAGSGADWPARLLAEYARLHLLIRAHDQLDTLPDGLAAVVRSHVGYPVARQDVLARPGVRDGWHVLGVRDVPDGSVPARRILLRGATTGRLALLLLYDPSGLFADHPDASLVPGLIMDADLHFYPGQPALRALVAERYDVTDLDAAPAPAADLAAALNQWSAALAADPWLTSWPVLVAGTPVSAKAGWQLAGPPGIALPLLTGPEAIWPLVAISGGTPVTVAGELTAAGLRPLTAWHGGQAVRL